MIKKKVFLASASELAEDRREFEVFVGRENKKWVDRGVFLDLVLWEDFLDALSRTRLQDEYNRAVRECDIFVMLFSTKVGRYTEEEFETAFRGFKATGKPFIFTYFKDAEAGNGSAKGDDSRSLRAFQQKLQALGHFHTRYEHIDGLKHHFSRQLEKLAASGFIEFKPDPIEAPNPEGGDRAVVAGAGAVAQGSATTAAGARGVAIGGNNAGAINTGAITRIDTGGGAFIAGSVTAGRDFVGRDTVRHGLTPDDVESLFAPLLTAIIQGVPAHEAESAARKAAELKAEVAKGAKAEDGIIAGIVEDLAGRAPGAIIKLIDLFAMPILGGIAGPVTKYVLDKLKADLEAPHGK